MVLFIVPIIVQKANARERRLVQGFEEAPD
jgi:hypothetical protein